MRTHYIQMIMLDIIPCCSTEAYVVGTQRHTKMLQYCGISNLYVLDSSRLLFHSLAILC